MAVSANQGPISAAVLNPAGGHYPTRLLLEGQGKSLTVIEETLYQTRARSPQDVLNYPIRLNNRLALLAGTVSLGDYRPTDQAEEVRQELTKPIDAELAKLRRVLEEDLASFNALLAKKKVPG